MNQLNIDNELIIEKFKIIELHLKRLKKLQGLSVGRFALDDNFAIAAWNLRCSLEATFDIGSHVLSRIPGVSFGTYKEIALKLGEQMIVPQDFAQGRLREMAGYRNRLTHFYFEVTPKEMYDIIQNYLGDFDTFLGYIKKML